MDVLRGCHPGTPVLGEEVVRNAARRRQLSRGLPGGHDARVRDAGP